MSKSLLKLLDNSIFPACIMVLGKLLGALLTIWIFNIPFTIRDYFNNFYSLRFVVNEENLTAVSSYSDLIMYIIVAIFFSFTIVRAVYLHSSHVKPTLITRLANSNLLKLIQSSYEIYHSATVWLIFMWLSNVLVLVNVFAGNTFLWIGIVITLTSIVLTAILLSDVYKEIENIKRKPGTYNWG